MHAGGHGDTAELQQHGFLNGRLSGDAETFGSLKSFLRTHSRGLSSAHGLLHAQQ